MIRNLLYAIAICLAVAFAIYLIHPVSLVSSAKAEEYRHCWDINGCPRKRYRRVARHRKPHPEPRYYAAPDRTWAERREDERIRSLCIDDYIEVVSTEHNTEDNAREAGKKLWMVQTAWRYGQQYIDLKNAMDYREKCGPSNPMDTVTGRLIEGAQRLAGADGQNVRCEISARPCSAPMEPVEGHKQ